MSFLIRSARENDLKDLLSLAQQFTLLSLPTEEETIKDKIRNSILSFSNELENDKANFLFVCEDLETHKVIACSQIKAKKGTPDRPCYSFRVLKKEHFSPDLSIGFIHQILRLHIETNGPSEVGGLIVDRNYRGRPEKIGKITSLARFSYISHCPDQFGTHLLAEMAPPLLPDGRSEFWESLGRRFTGIPYKEADALTENNKEFIRSLFPQEDIYVCLLDAKSRLALGQVGKETIPALKMLKSLGFTYINEVDPFDGGPHFSIVKENTTVFKNAKIFNCSNETLDRGEGLALISKFDENNFSCVQGPFKIKNEKVILTKKIKNILNLKESNKVLVYPLYKDNQ